jgi:hypothetical protein
MNFLSRKLGPTDSAADEKAHGTVHREIEITVERVWTKVSANARAAPSPPEEEPVS